MICCSLKRLFLIVDLLVDRLTYQLEENPGSMSVRLPIRIAGLIVH
jgi:hypothetical protein